MWKEKFKEEFDKHFGCGANPCLTCDRNAEPLISFIEELLKEEKGKCVEDLLAQSRVTREMTEDRTFTKQQILSIIEGKKRHNTKMCMRPNFQNSQGQVLYDIEEMQEKYHNQALEDVAKELSK